MSRWEAELAELVSLAYWNEGGLQVDGVAVRQGAPELEEWIARMELEPDGKLSHGISHLGALVAMDPHNWQWNQLLDSYLERAGEDAESLLPADEEERFFSIEAIRAYIWRHQGRLEESLQLLAEIASVRSDVPYLSAWALPWLEEPDALELLQPNVAMQVLSQAMWSLPEACNATMEQLGLAQRWAGVSEDLMTRITMSDEAVMLRSGILRRAGRFAEGQRIVEAALEINPSWHAAIALGLLHRYANDPKPAEAAFEYALKLDPVDVTAALEAGDMWFDRFEWQRAIDWYDRVVKLTPKHPWATASTYFARWALGDEEAISDLFKLSQAEQQNHRASELCQKALSPDIEEPHDALANMLRNMREEIRQQPEQAAVGVVQSASSSFEAPSNQLAFRLEMESLQHDLKLESAPAVCSDPDPREPCAEVDHQLWEYVDGVPQPALAPPSRNVAGRIAGLAQQLYDPAANWAEASRVALEIGAAQAEDVLATMVHPPAVPTPDLDAIYWLCRVQDAACQVLAQLDQGWQDSARRSSLYSVLHGPTDWTTVAGIRTLTRVAQQEPATAPDIHQAFVKLANHLPATGHCCWEQPLFESWLALPDLLPREEEILLGIARSLHEQTEPAE